jgi:hypothetical protein
MLDLKDLKFIKENAEVPRGGITSTARRGTKWSEEVATGDVVNLLVTESGANFGRAAIIGTKVKTLAEVCADVVTDNNHALAKLATDRDRRERVGSTHGGPEGRLW